MIKIIAKNHKTLTVDFSLTLVRRDQKNNLIWNKYLKTLSLHIVSCMENYICYICESFI